MLKSAGLGLLATCLVASVAFAADTALTTAPSTAPATQQADVNKADSAAIASLSDKELATQLKAAEARMDSDVTDPLQLLNPKTRADLAPEVVPLFHKIIALVDQIQSRYPDYTASLRERRNEILTFLDLLDDTDAIKSLDAAAASKDADEAIAAKSAQQFASWLRDNKDAGAQTKILDQMQAMAKANSQNDSLAGTLWVMSKFGAASPENSARAVDIISTDLKGEAAQRIEADMEQQREVDASVAGLKPLENKPIIVAGTALDGKNFTSADWKGKVVLVDFWATWCIPCREELPNVKKLYTDYHAKGLEIIGVSCDQDIGDLKAFIKDDGNMPWPQLFDPKQTDWGPTAKKFGVNAIPTMFVIDKNGVLRSVEGRETAATLVPRLLAETPTTQPTTAPAQK